MPTFSRQLECLVSLIWSWVHHKEFYSSTENEIGSHSQLLSPTYAVEARNLLLKLHKDFPHDTLLGTYQTHYSFWTVQIAMAVTVSFFHSNFLTDPTSLMSQDCHCLLNPHDTLLGTYQTHYRFWTVQIAMAVTVSFHSNFLTDPTSLMSQDCHCLLNPDVLHQAKQKFENMLQLSNIKSSSNAKSSRLHRIPKKTRGCLASLWQLSCLQ